MGQAGRHAGEPVSAKERGKWAKAEQNGNLNTFALLNDQKSTDPPSMLRVSVMGANQTVDEALKVHPSVRPRCCAIPRTTSVPVYDDAFAALCEC